MTRERPDPEMRTLRRMWLSRDILRLLEDAPRALTASEIAEALGFGRYGHRHIQSALRELLRDGLARRVYLNRRAYFKPEGRRDGGEGGVLIPLPRPSR